MKKILVPVDFTENSLNAYRYANNLANAINASITILHVYASDLILHQPLTLLPENQQVVLTEKLKVYITSLPFSESKPLYPVNTDFVVISGSAVSGILQFINEIPHDLIVMGTRDKHGKVDSLLGTVSLGVSRAAFCPVMLVR